jgi:nucleoside-diphosphate-sugar epimerase
VVLAVTGSTGFVGRAVLDEAAAQGVVLRALTRRPQEPIPGVQWVRGDLADTGALQELVTGTQAVLHIAGVVSSADADGFLEGNVRGAARLVAAAQAAAVRRFVLVSSLAAREPGLSAYGDSKREGERIVEASGLDWTIVRPPAVYGPRDTELFQLFRAATWGVVPMPPAGRNSVIHVGDLARLLLALVAGGAGVPGAVFEPDDGREGGWPHREFARAIGRAVGRRVLAPRVPAPLFTAAARLDRRLRGAGAKLTPDRARYMLHPDWVCSPERRVPATLWSPRIPTEEGLAATAAWYRAAGWL